MTLDHLGMLILAAGVLALGLGAWHDRRRG